MIITKKRVFVRLSIVLILFILLITVWIKVNSRDLPAPDTSDLSIQLIQIPDHENAYTYFREAVDSLYWPEDDVLVGSILNKRAWNEDFVNQLLSKNQQTLGLIEKGLDCSVLIESKDLRSEDNGSLYNIVNISKVMAVKSIYELKKANPDGAFQCSLNLFRLGSLIMSGNDDTTKIMLGLYPLDMAYEQFEHLFAESVLSEQMLIILSEHLKTFSIDQAMIDALKYEFKIWYNIIEKVESGKSEDISNDIPWIVKSLSMYSFHPNRTRTILSDYYRKSIENAHDCYVDLQQPEKKGIKRPPTNRLLLFIQPNAVGKIIMALTPEPEIFIRLFKAKYQIQCKLLALHIIVACHLYELKYGRAPETLVSLVPEFLEEVPKDPFDGRPFRYLQKEGIIYSVGSDLIDTTGTTELPKTAIPIPKQSDDLIYPIHPQTEQIRIQ